VPNVKLTNTYIRGLEAGARDVIHWDVEVRGFGIKVTPAGRKVFLVQYRPDGHAGNPRKFTIGTFGDLTVELARRKAREIVAAKAQGKDPQAEKRAAKTKYGSDSFSDVLERFVTQHVAQTRSALETERLLRKDFLSAWGSRSVHASKD
jgi:Arm DNA-binding domain